MKFFTILMMAGCLVALGARGDVWQDLAAYKYGNPTNAGDEADKLLQQTPVAQHAAIEEALIKVVSSETATPDGKAIACRLLQQVATDKAVPAVAGLLTDEVLSHYARLVLERLAKPKADAALRTALDKAPDKAKVGIIGSLGERRDGLAVKQLAGLAGNADQAVAAAALNALGKIGNADAASSLLNAKVADSLKSVHMEALALCARHLKGSEAVSLYMKVLKEGTPSSRVSALAGLFRVDEKTAISITVEILKGDDEKVQRGVLALLADGAGTAATTRALTDLLSSLPDAQKVGVITALGGRGDKTALGAVTGYATSTDAVIREAAYVTLSKIGDDATVKLLVGLSETDAKAAEALSKMQGETVNRVLVSLLDDGKLQVAAVKALAARSVGNVVPALIKLLGAPDAGMRKALWAGLASLATETDLPGIATAAFAIKDENESADALSAMKRICAQASDKGKCFDVVSAYYAQATPAAKGSILEMGAAIATPAALELERNALKSDNSDLYGKALRSLAVWENESAAGDLLALAQNAPTEKDRTLALRGYIQMAAKKEFRLNPKQRMEMFEKADALAKRLDEKRLIMSGLEVAGNAEALNMAGKYLDNSDLCKEAEQASLSLLRSVKQKHPAEVKALAEKLLTSKNAGVVSKAKEILASKTK